MDIPAGIAANLALTRQAIALSVIKQASEAEKMRASIIDQAARNVPASSVRGGNVNFSV